MNYTKGEWKVGEFGSVSNKVIYVQKGTELYERERIADCYDNEANAQLIAAAPEMYEALKWWAEHFNLIEPDGERPNIADCKKITKQALAKAEGK